MKPTLSFVPTLFAAAALGACSGDDHGTPTPSTVMKGPSGIVVLNSDYDSTSISLLDPVTATLSHDNCITSGTQSPSLSLALSGDVVLPSSPQPAHDVVLIDRFNAALTWVDPATCQVKAQMSVGTGFPSDPQDILGLSASKAYVPRAKRNPTPTEAADDHDDGDDLLIIDPTTATVTGRIDLAPFAATVGETTLWARANRLLLANGRVYVALAHLSGDFKIAGEGRILVVDPATDTVSGMIDLPGLKGCLGMSYRADSKTLVVTCGGSFNDAVQVDGSGVVAVDVGATPPAITVKLGASALGGQPASWTAGGVLTATTGLAVSIGALKVPPGDRLWSYDATDGTATQIMEAKESFVFGDLLFDPARHQMFFADATTATPRVHVIDVSGAPLLTVSLNANPETGLPPRFLAWY